MIRLMTAMALMAAGLGAWAVFVPEPRFPEDTAPATAETPAPSSLRYDAECYVVAVYVNGQSVITYSRNAAQFCADRVIVLSECPIFADGFEAPTTGVTL